MSDKKPLELNTDHIRVDTYRVGKFMAFGTAPEIGVRLTHIPSGLVVDESSERSLHRNMVVAMERLTELVLAHSEVTKTDYNPKPEEPAKAKEHHASTTHVLSFVDRDILYRATVNKGMTSGLIEIARIAHHSCTKVMTDVELALFRQLWEKEMQ